MKDKNIAAVLAFFLGFLGVHRFYLGQVGLGIFYLIFAITGISAILAFFDFIAFLVMDRRVFDVKYNREYLEDDPRYDTDFSRDRKTWRDRRREEQQRYRTQENHYQEQRTRRRSNTEESRPRRPANPYKESGMQRYKDFEFEAAIKDFKKALEVNPNDIAVHFNLACANSLLENKDDAFFYLDRAVELGFVDFEKIKTHDALAYMRIQDEFDDFSRNGYRFNPVNNSPQEEAFTSTDLLDQLKKLGDLRDRGLLTDEEFQIQKKKLLG